MKQVIFRDYRSTTRPALVVWTSHVGMRTNDVIDPEIPVKEDIVDLGDLGEWIVIRRRVSWAENAALSIITCHVLPYHPPPRDRQANEAAQAPE